MKRALCALLLAALVLSSAGCSKTIKGSDGLIAKAREEINLANADTTEIKIVDFTDAGKSRLVWFMTGNEYQAQSCFPMEFEVVGEDKYKFVHEYMTIGRGTDIWVLPLWKDGYSFLINNDRCVKIEIIDQGGKTIEIPVDGIPFHYFYEDSPDNFSYHFLDAEGKEI